MPITLQLTEDSKREVEANPELVATWTKALRSGEYNQVRNTMTIEGDCKSACCLMVMEVACNDRKHEEALSLDVGLPSDLYNAIEWPEGLQARIVGRELFSYNPSEWNDELYASFEEIADLLDKGEVVVQNVPSHWEDAT